ncbi:3D domain-containing protein [Carboxydothermus ferrireducens]|uniref:3D (Asp-Asp-Asp) domain-containing protein n=1 Tax=Carboxydothermus ferrireducens DSM 11255 TaxID=1119529 RepID=A0ABX2R869_9THEO|nr:3D domain-containing protein [Carboxydothermus ferrireducens]NYE57114.1 3D (Asp-Asp-Asp) domain-containing protein [Carboxydothermus ferrireducens DSM 11255]
MKIRVLGAFLLAVFVILTPVNALEAKTVSAPKKATTTKTRKTRTVKVSRNINYRTAEFLVTAYTHTGNKTCSGTWPKYGTVAVDPEVVPLGTKLYIPGYGYGVAEDTGGKIKGNQLDVFFPNREDAVNWGVRRLEVRIFLD